MVRNKIYGENIAPRERGYSQNYAVHVWPDHVKIDLWIAGSNGYEVILKLSEAECEELITRLTYALLQGRVANGTIDPNDL